MDHTSWKILLIIILATEGKRSYLIFINESMTWLGAQSTCHSHNGYLMRAGEEVNNTCTRQNFKRMPRYWLGMFTSLTPYISHLGCYRIPPAFNINESSKKEIRSVGECYDHCGKSNYTRFGIMDKHCVCLIEHEANQMIQLDRSSCNVSCNAFKEEEYCGGEGTLNVYYIEGKIHVDGNGRCIYIECADPYGQLHQTVCTDRLKGRICGNGITHMNSLNLSEALRTCEPAYLKSSTHCVSDSLQAGVKYWLDIRKYELLQFDRQGTDIISNEIPYMCVLHMEGGGYHLRNCSILNHAVCITDKVESNRYPFCSNEKDESNTVIDSTLPETTEITRLSSQYEMNKSAVCPFCATEHAMTGTETGFTESKNIESDRDKNDGATIWGSILGTITVLTGCSVGMVVYYRKRCITSKNDGTDIKENTSDEGPNISYFVLEAKAAHRESTVKNNTTYDNAYQHCDLASSGAKVSENEESVYAEQPDDVYDELNKRRRVNKTTHNQNENVYSENMVDTVADNGVYNTLDSTIQNTDMPVPYTIEDSEGYGHLKMDGLKESTDSNYDHCCYPQSISVLSVDAPRI